MPADSIARVGQSSDSFGGKGGRGCLTSEVLFRGIAVALISPVRLASIIQPMDGFLSRAEVGILRERLDPR